MFCYFCYNTNVVPLINIKNTIMKEEDFLKKAGEAPNVLANLDKFKNMNPEEIAELKSRLHEEIPEPTETVDPTQYKTLKELNLKNLTDKE